MHQLYVIKIMYYNRLIAGQDLSSTNYKLKFQKQGVACSTEECEIPKALFFYMGRGR
jgi:hypothetical protein